MIYLLDTNVCITFLRGRNPAIAQKLATMNKSDIALCSIVKAELYFGIHRSHNPERSSALLGEFLSPFKSLPFDDMAAEQYGKLRAELTQKREIIGPNDLLIASIALSHDATLVTHNTREFFRVSGLTVEDWE